jgi:GNAT superfamily N-acetyltransferase
MTADAESNPSKGDGIVAEEQKEATRQRALDSLNILDTAPEERFDQVTRLAKRLFGVESAAITLIDRDRQWFKSRIGIDFAETPRSDAFCNTTIRDSQLMTVPDASADPRFSENPLVAGDPNIRFYAGYPLEGPGGERLGALCLFDPSPREFSGTEAELLRELAQWVQNEMMADRDLQRAVDVQRGLLPKQLVGLPGYEVAADCVPAHAVGGDFYDWYTVAGGAVFTLADVMGKGIGAAIMAATVRAVLRSSSWQEDGTLGLERACQTLCPDLEEAGIFVTLFQSRLDVETGVLRYVDAGHGLTLVVHADGETDRLATTSFPLGAGTQETWVEETVTLDPGDTLVALSDGVLDLFDGSLGSLDEVAKIARSSISAQAVVDTIVAMASTALAPDDVSLLVVRRAGSEL